MKKLSVVLAILTVASCARQEQRRTVGSVMEQENKGVISLGQPQGLDDEWSRSLVGEWESSGESDLAGFQCWVKGTGRVKMELGVGGQFLVVSKQGQVAQISDEYLQYLRQNVHASEEEVEKLRRMKFAAVEYFTIDPRTGGIVAYVFDSWRCVATGAGRREGNREIMEWTWSAGGQGTSVRTTQRVGKSRLVVTETYRLPDGGTMEDRVQMVRKK